MAEDRGSLLHQLQNGATSQTVVNRSRTVAESRGSLLHQLQNGATSQTVVNKSRRMAENREPLLQQLQNGTSLVQQCSACQRLLAKVHRRWTRPARQYFVTALEAERDNWYARPASSFSPPANLVWLALEAYITLRLRWVANLPSPEPVCIPTVCIAEPY